MESPDSLIGKMETCPVCNRRMKVKDPAVIAEEKQRKQLAVANNILSQREANDRRVISFHTKVVGVTHRNDNGRSRQKIIAKCRIAEQLVFDHDEYNPHDPNAVKVCRQNGAQIGFLNNELAQEVVNRSKNGYRYAVWIKNLTGGTSDAPTLGVNLLIVVASPGVSDRESQKYMDQLEWA